VPAPNYDASPRRRISPGRIGSIGIDQIRELRMDSVLAPARSRWRVYAILDADRLTTEAMNAILKTLEEPPAHVVLILTAERIDALLPTIVSRCQLVRFGAVPRDMLASTLVGRLHVDEGRAYQLSCISRGRIGWAILALSEPAISEARDDALDRLRGLLRDGTIGRLEAASRLADRYGRDREDVLAVLETWVGWWRDAILVSAGAGEMIANVDREADLTEVGRRLSALDLRVATNAISAAVDNLAANVNPRMAFEHMVLTLPDPSSGRL
jgi:DNA polymerase-3 subunit delta'